MRRNTRCHGKETSMVMASTMIANTFYQYDRTIRTVLCAIFSVFFSCSVFLATPVTAQTQNSGPWIAGQFSFSDELGGFRITGIAGSGTREDPAHIKQVFDTSYDGTMVIHRIGPIKKELKDAGLGASHGTVYMRIETTNNSNLSWVGLGFELQEVLNVVSTYGDGLSFDQLSRQRNDVYSDRFLDFEDQFEPGDRLVFTDGFVNNLTSVDTRFVITDFTPTRVFYLLQDPLIPAS